MTSYTIHARAFHPDKLFGPGGLWFSGDDRGFTTDLGVTSRIKAKWELDFFTSAVTDRRVRSDPSHNNITGQTEHYTTPETQPTEDADFRASGYTAEGMQTGNLQWQFRGINHAFTPSIGVNNAVVPYLDLSGAIAFAIDRHPDHRTMQITSTLHGDGFPNSEVFIIDSVGMAVMLNTHHRMGYAAGQLFGDRQNLLGGTQIIININADGAFVGPIQAVRSVDFMPEARDLLIEHDGWFRDTYRTNYSVSAWNRLHTNRDPSFWWPSSIYTDVIRPGLDTHVAHG